MGKGNKGNKVAQAKAAKATAQAMASPPVAQANGLTFAADLTGLPATPVAATLVGSTASPVSKGNLWQFINANGGPGNVYVVPLANVATAQGVNPVPFGYNGQPNGVRKTIQTWLLNGVQGVRTYAAIMGAAKPLGHSSIKPVCLFAMLNGGYSPSSPVWGTPYCALVAYAPAAQASEPAAQASEPAAA